MSSPLALLKAFVLLLALVLVPVAVFGLCCTVTWQGRLLSSAVGMIGLGPLLWCIGHERESLLQGRLGKILLLAGIAGFAVVDWRSPDGHTAESARVHTRYSTSDGRHIPWSIGSLLPEIDQIHLGYAVAVAFDPLFTWKQRTELSTMTDTLYAEMNADPDFTAIGSALPAIYREMSFEEFRDGHYFHYIPANVDRSKPTPTLVFLHGSGGNFKVYLWLLSKVADETGCTVIAPTFGMGNWEKRGGYEAITRAIADAGKHVAIAPDQIHLMGLSNGGKGVCLAESQPGPQFRSLIFLSGVFHNRIKPEELAARLKPRPVLVLSGGSDDRVPWDYVSSYAEKLKTGGLSVTTRPFADEDHFVFFRQRDEVLRSVAEWLKSLPKPAAAP